MREPVALIGHGGFDKERGNKIARVYFMDYKYKRFKPLSSLFGRLEKGPNLIQVIIGPRQVGKTTAIQQYFENSKWLSIYQTADLFSPPSIMWVEDQWNNARKSAKINGSAILILDEVQKIPRWSEALKKLHDEDIRRGVNLRVIILGSSALMVQKGLKESLAGRFEIIPFTHWTYEECSQAFDLSLDEYIFFGGYPGAISVYQESNGDEIRWQRYVRDALIETVIGKDILLLTPVDKPALFRQVFHLACAYPAQILPFTKMLGQLNDAGNTTTIASYIQIMQAAGMIVPLQKYSGSKIRERASSPKLLLLNNALINASMARGYNDAKNNSVLWGQLVENAVGSHLYNQLVHFGCEVFYWREGQDEIDYVVRKGETLVGLEVKSGRQKQGRGFHAFKNRYKNARAIVVGGSDGDFGVADFLFSDPKAIL